MTLVCDKHHRALHEGGATMVRRKDGALIAYGGDGRRFDQPITTVTDAGRVEAHNIAHGHTIDHTTHRCQWLGRAPDISDIIHHLDLSHDRHAQHQARRDQKTDRARPRM